MSRRLVLAAALGLVVAAAAAAALGWAATRGAGADELAGAVWVANEGSDSISVVDVATNRVVATLTGVAAPHNVQAGNGMEVWATAASGNVLLLERHYDVHLERPTGRHPAHVVQVLRGDVYVTNEEDDTVTVVTAPRLGQLTLPVGRAPHGLRPSPDGRSVLVANRLSGTVTLIDADARRVVAEIRVGREPVQVAFAPDGRSAYVTLRGEDAVARVDLAARKVVAKTPVGRGPIQLHGTPDGRLLVVANQGTTARPGRTVSLVETEAFREVAQVETGAGAHGVVVEPSGRRAYVTNLVAGTLSVVDLAERREVAEIRTGVRPNGVTYLRLEPMRAARPIDLGRGGGHGH